MIELELLDDWVSFCICMFTRLFLAIICYFARSLWLLYRINSCFALIDDFFCKHIQMNSRQSIIRFCSPPLDRVKNLFWRSFHFGIKFLLSGLALSNLDLKSFLTQLLVKALFRFFIYMFHNIQFVHWLIHLVWTQNDLMAFIGSWCNIISTSAVEAFWFMLRRIGGCSSVELFESLLYDLLFSHSWFWLDSHRLFFTDTTFGYFYE